MGNPAMLRTAPATGAGGPAAAPAAGNGAAPADRKDFLATLAAALGGEAQGAGETVEPRPGDDDAGTTEEGDGDEAALLAGLLQVIAPAAGRPAADGRLRGTGDPPDMNGAARQLLAGALPDAAGGRPGAGTDPAADPAAADGLELMQQLARPAGLATRELIPELRLAAGAEFQVAPNATAAATTALQAASAGQLLRAAVGTPQWADELGSRLVMMSTRGQHEGSLTLSPEHLGPLEVRISVQHNNAQVWFGAQHADTRAALAEALPRLREMFAEAGLSLGQAGVSHEAPRRQADPLAADASYRGDAEPDAPEPLPVAARPLSSALLDLYA